MNEFCIACGTTDQWERLTDYYSFHGELMISFMCGNCKHIQTVREIDLNRGKNDTDQQTGKKPSI